MKCKKCGEFSKQFDYCLECFKAIKPVDAQASYTKAHNQYRLPILWLPQSNKNYTARKKAFIQGWFK